MMTKPRVGLPSTVKPVWKSSQRHTVGGEGGHTDFHGDSESYHIGNEEEAFQGACL